MDSSDAHLDAARKRLCHLAVLRHRTNEADKAITTAAGEELERVQSDLPRLAPRVHLDPSAADAYQRRVMDTGRLRTLLGQAAARA